MSNAKATKGPTREALAYEAIAKALFVNYESIYDIDIETSAYKCYHQSDAYSSLCLDNHGQDFFAALPADVRKVVYPDDQAYVISALSRQRLLDGIRREKYYICVFRLMLDGAPVYHKTRATLAHVDGRDCILIGVRNIDDIMRTEREYLAELASMQQKQKNHLEVILTSAAGYLEVNLTQDMVLDRSAVFIFEGDSKDNLPLANQDPPRYSAFIDLICGHLAETSIERYAHVASRDYLLGCFERGERRASIHFSSGVSNGGIHYWREVFFLYQDDASGDIFSFCVLYDQTKQEQKERELAELENALRMCRIRNSTSQMQPHFLYNALGSIQEVVLDDPAYASELLGDFTVHLRSCIRAMEDDNPVPFWQELDNIKAYVNIEKMRFGEKLKVVYEIDATEFSILPLSIQPLVENAIRHGVYQRGMQGGAVTIRSMDRGDAWRIQVEDNGVGFDYEAFQRDVALGRRDSTGLKNLMFRLDKVMHASIDIHSRVGQGTVVTVEIPKEGDIQ